MWQILTGLEKVHFAVANAPKIIVAVWMVERSISNTNSSCVCADTRSFIAKFTLDEVDQILRREGGVVLRQEAGSDIDFNMDFHYSWFLLR